MATYIFVHGSFHGGWCWERIVPLIEAAGHRAIAPDLPGTGGDSTAFAQDVLAQWADFTAELIRAQDESVILVGHSRGGVVISETAERVPERVARLVYVAAALLPAGVSLLQSASGQGEPGLSIEIDPASGTCTMRSDQQRACFYHLCPDADAGAAMARLCPEPLAAVMQPVRVTPERFGTVARAYVETAEDQAISLDHQRSMHAILPCDPVITLESDHSPFYSAPCELADALLSLAR